MFPRRLPLAALCATAVLVSFAAPVNATVDAASNDPSAAAGQAQKQSSAPRSATADTATRPIKVAASAAPAVAKAAKPVAKKKPNYPTLKVSIDLTRQRMTVREHGKVKHTFKISSGRKGFRTPTGSYRPQWMTRMHYSKKYDNAPMPHSIFFYKGYAIHATYATGRLGAPASHGCIRLSPKNAKRLYRLVQKHKRARTRIAITGVAKDRPARVAKKKKTYRHSQKKTTYKKRKPKKTYTNYTYSYAQPSHRRTWPGDAPRRRLRY
ncbi:MAG: L,D-transpeptidase [Pseudomonadota bacterium]